ncbi:MAG: hypothetical protein RLZZ116_2648 [Planctomycetota bacterium]|jgi:hypothetical protein
MSGSADDQGGAHGQEPVDPAKLVERAQADAALLAEFNTCVTQSDEMLQKGGVPAQRARDIAFARSLLFLPEWNIVACAMKGEKEPEIKHFAMIEVKGPDGKSCPSLAVFPTATVARAESLRMRVPIEGGFWVTLSAPIGGVVEWLKSLQVQAVSVVNSTPSTGPSCVLGVDFIDWVKKVEAQQQQQQQQ